MKKSCIASPVPHRESSLRHLPLVDLLVDAKTDLLELALRSGRRSSPRCSRRIGMVICGPRYAHEPERPAVAPAPPAARSGRPEGYDSAPARADDGRLQVPPRPPRRRADAGRRRHPPVGRRSLEPLGPEMKSRGPARARSAAASSRAWPRSSRPGERAPRRPRSRRAADRRSASRRSLPHRRPGYRGGWTRTRARASGTARRKTPPSAQACSRISRVAASGPTAASSSSPTSRRPCAKRYGRPSAPMAHVGEAPNRL